MDKDKIIRMAIQCQLVNTSNREGIYMDALEAFAKLVLKEVLEQPVKNASKQFHEWAMDEHAKLNANPPAAQQQWAGLTDEDKLQIEIMGGKSDVLLAEMVETKLKARNA